MLAGSIRIRAGRQAHEYPDRERAGDDEGFHNRLLATRGRARGLDEMSDARLFAGPTLGYLGMLKMSTAMSTTLSFPSFRCQ